jgi:hypothetical protein
MIALWHFCLRASRKSTTDNDDFNFHISRIAEASISEEPGAGKLHAGRCAGDGG